MHYPVLRQLVLPLVAKKIRQINGLENLPQPPFIIAANHQGFIDPFIIVYAVLKKFNDKPYFFTTQFFWKIFGRHLAVHWLGMIPISRANKGQSVEIAKEYVKQGKIVGIFPEGTRNIDQTSLLKGKTGALRLALAAKVPISPWGLVNPTGHRIGKAFFSFMNSRKELIVNIGQPLYFDEYYDKEITKEILESVTRKMMVEIGKLCDKSYPY